jgi:hypothetical protein
MKRQEFLVVTGGLLTAAMLHNLASMAEKKTNYSVRDARDRRPDPEQYDAPIVRALAFGLNAPNPHNTQAWKFKVLNEREALFFVDENRLLTSTDPLARQIHIGCGAFLALFRLGAGSLGYVASIDYLPEGGYGFSEIGTKPVARLSLVKGDLGKEGDQGNDVLVKQIFSRQTTRTVYHGHLLTNSEFEKILALAKGESSSIELINDPRNLQPVLDLLYKGMEVECYDWNAFDESRKWFRVKKDIASKRDGLNLRVSGVEGGLNLWLSETLLEGYPKKLWHNEGSIEGLLKSHYDKVMSSKGVVLFKTSHNDLLDWIKCGEDYARFQLAAYDQGFCLHPLSQVLQEYPSMKTLADAFNQLMGIREPAKIQMAVRIGRSKPTEYSYRRLATDFILPA